LFNDFCFYWQSLILLYNWFSWDTFLKIHTGILKLTNHFLTASCYIIFLSAVGTNEQGREPSNFLEKHTHPQSICKTLPFHLNFFTYVFHIFLLSDFLLISLPVIMKMNVLIAQKLQAMLPSVLTCLHTYICAVCIYEFSE